MSEKAGKGIIADENTDIQTISLNIPLEFQAENPRDSSQSGIKINFFSNILDQFTHFRFACKLN